MPNTTLTNDQQSTEFLNLLANYFSEIFEVGLDDVHDWFAGYSDPDAYIWVREKSDMVGIEWDYPTEEYVVYFHNEFDNGDDDCLLIPTGCTNPTDINTDTLANAIAQAEQAGRVIL